MDLSQDPGSDFYRYANGGWLDRTEIPQEKSTWGLGSEVNEANQELLLTILEDAGRNGSAGSGSLEKKLGDFWAAAMDVDQIEAQGAAPLTAELARIEALSSSDRAGFARTVAHLHSIGVDTLFAAGSEAGLQDPTQVMLWMLQGGLGLPDRDYYSREGEEADALREQYVEHVANMFVLLGDEAAPARANADVVMAIETRLAAASLRNVELRNPQNLNREITVAEAIAESTAFDLEAYLVALGHTDLERINKPMPAFFHELDTMLDEVPRGEWQQYLRWGLVTTWASALSSAFEEEDFRFKSTVLAGTPEMEPRWKRMLAAVNGTLGEALGELYVARAFSPRAKSRATQMVDDLLEVMAGRIERLDWMGADTRVQALEKLRGFGRKLGYPDEWRDYSELEIDRVSFAGNMLRAAQHEFRYDMSKVGKPVDPNEWGMTPQTLNAYYHPLRNEIVFPAAILQPPFFSEDADDPLNYGAIGAVIGHEITHGFDDSGSQFDAEGKLRNWWTDADRAEFEARAQRIVEQYGRFEVLPGVFVNGELTLGENLADLGGLSIAFEAMQRANAGIPDPLIDGFTREQRFFLAFGRVWRKKSRDEALKLQVNTDPHSPARFRVFGPLSNMDEFAEAFDIPANAPVMLPAEERARIW